MTRFIVQRIKNPEEIKLFQEGAIHLLKIYQPIMKGILLDEYRWYKTKFRSS